MGFVGGEDGRSQAQGEVQKRFNEVFDVYENQEAQVSDETMNLDPGRGTITRQRHDDDKKRQRSSREQVSLNTQGINQGNGRQLGSIRGKTRQHRG